MAFEGLEAIVAHVAHGRIVVVRFVLDELPALVAGRHHGQGAGFYTNFRQGNPTVATQLWRYFPVERILMEIATAPLLFDDCGVLDPYLIGKAFHWPFQQGPP